MIFTSIVLSACVLSSLGNQSYGEKGQLIALAQASGCDVSTKVAVLERYYDPPNEGTEVVCVYSATLNPRLCY
jgi:ABC-type multidrug transport system fused ATPase/permease subunit